MSANSSFCLSIGCVLAALCELAGYALRFCWALLLPKAMLAARLVAAESQLAVAVNRPGGKRRRRLFTPAFRILWVALSKLLNQSHLEGLLREYLEHYYHTARPHQGLGGETPVPQAPGGEGELISMPVVGGLHHRYYRAAA